MKSRLSHDRGYGRRGTRRVLFLMSVSGIPIVHIGAQEYRNPEMPRNARNGPKLWTAARSAEWRTHHRPTEVDADSVAGRWRYRPYANSIPPLCTRISYHERAHRQWERAPAWAAAGDESASLLAVKIGREDIRGPDPGCPDGMCGPLTLPCKTAVNGALGARTRIRRASDWLDERSPKVRFMRERIGRGKVRQAFTRGD